MTLIPDTRSINLFIGIPYREKFLLYDTDGSLFSFGTGTFSGYIGSLRITQNNGMIEYNKQEGEIVVDISEPTMLTLSAGATTYSITFTDFNGQETVVAGGTATIFERMILSLGATGTAWDDLRVAASGTHSGALRAPGLVKVRDNGSGSTGVWAFGFDTSTEEEVHFQIQIPHAWKIGTDLYPHMHYTVLTNGSAGQTVQWGLEYSVANIQGTFPQTTIINTVGATLVPNEDPLQAYRHYLLPFSNPISGSALNISAMFFCRLFRDVANDNYGVDAIGIEFDIHYEIDAWGSPQLYSKP